MFKKSLLLSSLLIILLFLGYFYKFFYYIVIFIELWAPFYLIEKNKEDLKNYALQKFTFSLIKKDFPILLLFCLLLIFIYTPIFALFYNANFINFIIPDNLIYSILTNILVAALPEEIFYRGFLEHSLSQKFKPLTATIITNLFFALGHFVAGFNFVRLLTFFPGLVFSFLTKKTGSIFSSVVFHALCNIWEQFLYLNFVVK